MTRVCSDCPAEISDRSSGRCRSCAMRVVALTENYKNRRMRQAPVFTAEQIERMRRVCAQYGVTVAAEILHTSTAAISRVKRRGWTVGIRGPQPRPRPTDFAIQANEMSIHELAKHYGAGISTINRWSAEVGRKPMKGHKTPRLELRSDAVELADSLGFNQAAVLCGCHPDTLRKRVKEMRRDRSVSNQTIGWAERRFAA